MKRWWWKVEAKRNHAYRTINFFFRSRDLMLSAKQNKKVSFLPVDIGNEQRKFDKKTAVRWQFPLHGRISFVKLN